MLLESQIEQIRAAGVPEALEAALNSSDPLTDETIACTMCFLPYYCRDEDSDEDSGSIEGPKILPCGHVFGAKCLRTWVEGRQGMAEFCPKCRLELRFRICDHVIMPLPFHSAKITKVSSAFDLPDSCVHYEYDARTADLPRRWRSLLRERYGYPIPARQLLRHWTIEVLTEEGSVTIPDLPEVVAAAVLDPISTQVGQLSLGSPLPEDVEAEAAEQVLVPDAVPAGGQAGDDQVAEAAEGLAPVQRGGGFNHLVEIETFEPDFSEDDEEQEEEYAHDYYFDEEEDFYNYDYDLPRGQPAQITQETADIVNQFNERCLAFVQQAGESIARWEAELEDARASTTEFRLAFELMED